MAWSIWQRPAMSKLAIALFGVLDSGVWDLKQFHAWNDRIISTISSPPTWLFDLSTCKSIGECLEVLRQVFRKSGTALPDDFGDLLAGFVLLRLDGNEVSPHDARLNFVDIADAYGTSCVDAEVASVADLRDSIFAGVRRSAREALNSLQSYDLSLLFLDLGAKFS